MQEPERDRENTREINDEIERGEKLRVGQRKEEKRKWCRELSGLFKHMLA